MDSSSTRELQTYILDNGLTRENAASLQQVTRATKLPPAQAHRLLNSTHGNPERAIEVFQDLLTRQGGALVAPSTISPKPPSPSPSVVPGAHALSSSRSAVMAPGSEIVLLGRPEYSPPHRSFTLVGGVMVEKKRSPHHVDPGQVFLLSKYRNIVNVGSRPFRYYLRPNLSVYIHSCQNLKPSGLHQVEVQLNGQPGPRTGWLEGAPYPVIRTTFEFDNFEPDKAWIRIIVWERRTIRGHRQVGDLVISTSDLKDVEESLVPPSFPMRVRYLKTTRYLDHRDAFAARLTCEFLMTELKPDTGGNATESQRDKIEVGIQTGDSQDEGPPQDTNPLSRFSHLEGATANDVYPAAVPLLGEEATEDGSNGEDAARRSVESESINAGRERKKDKAKKKSKKKKSQSALDPFAVAQSEPNWDTAFQSFPSQEPHYTAPTFFDPHGTLPAPALGQNPVYMSGGGLLPHQSASGGIPVQSCPPSMSPYSVAQKPNCEAPPRIVSQTLAPSENKIVVPAPSHPVHFLSNSDFVGHPIRSLSDLYSTQPSGNIHSAPEASSTAPEVAPLPATDIHSPTHSKKASPEIPLPVSNVDASERSSVPTFPGSGDRSYSEPTEKPDWPKWPDEEDEEDWYNNEESSMRRESPPAWETGGTVETRPVLLESSSSTESSIDSSESSENWPPAPMPDQQETLHRLPPPPPPRKTPPNTRVFDIPERTAQKAAVSPTIDFSTDFQPIDAPLTSQKPPRVAAAPAASPFHVEEAVPTRTKAKDDEKKGERDWFNTDENPWAEAGDTDISQWSFS